MDPPQRTDLHSTLEAVADATLLVDNHAHPFCIPDHTTNTFSMPKLAQVLSEAAHDHPSAARATLAFCRSLRDLHGLVLPDARLFRDSSAASSDDVDDEHRDDDHHGLDHPAETERAIEAIRAEMGPWNLAKRCFGAAGIAAVLIDDGLACPRGALPVNLHDFPNRLNVPIARRVLRLEMEAEKTLTDLVTQNQDHVWSRGPRPVSYTHSPDKKPRTTLRAQQFRNAFSARLDPLPPNVVSFKSIAAYRSGLAVNLDWTDEDLEDALAKMSYASLSASEGSAAQKIRLEDKVIVDCVVRIGLQVAKRHAIPIQIHCGFGDTDLDLKNANPVLLRQVFKRFPDVAIVLLHAAWPYTREAAYLAAAYPSVYLDVGLAIPLLSVRGMFKVVDEALEIAPITKVLYSSDAHSTPDVFFLAARWGRRVIAGVIAASVISGDLGQAEAKAAIRKILAENATQLYKLPIHQAL